MTNFSIKVVFLCIALTSLYGGVNAQVTIGMDAEPVKGALLQLKNLDPQNPAGVTDPSNITVDDKGGGLLLPRVILEDRTTLQPFFTKAESDANAGKIKEKHTGLTVYNIKVITDPSDSNKTFRQGMYVWDGSKWTEVGQGSATAAAQKYFYIPSFNIDLTGAPECNLYDMYAYQFTKSGNGTFVSSNNAISRVPSPSDTKLYARTELDYVITYYDTNVITNVNVDATGKMTWTKVAGAIPGPDSFVNVVFIVK